MDELTTTRVRCPYCGEAIDLLVDRSAGPSKYVEDCSVCCRPLHVIVQLDAQGDVRVEVRHEDA